MPETSPMLDEKRAPAMLKLDTAKFEKYAKAVADSMPLPFVTLVEHSTATISTDLSRYLPERPIAEETYGTVEEVRVLKEGGEHAEIL